MSNVATGLDRIEAAWWMEDNPDRPSREGDRVHLDVEREDVDEVAIHAMIDGTGSHSSLYVSVERARELAFQLLAAARPRF